MKTFIICGLMKNNSKYIRLFKKKIKLMYKLKNLKLLKIIIFENDSSDNTLQKLKKWKNNDLIILSEKDVNIKERIKIISYGRNKLLEFIKNNNYNPNYLIMIDTDDVLIKFNPMILDNIPKIKKKWAMLGGNSNVYYDLFALRMGKKYNDNLDYLNYSIKDRLKKFYFKIPILSKLIEVESCFNGIGIYKYKFIKNLNYDGNKKLCEHVFLNRMIINNGGKIFIYPKLIMGPHKIQGSYKNTTNNYLIKY
jgi:hypothetical protein